MVCLLNGTPYCCSSCITLRLTIQLNGQNDFHFVAFKITHVFANYPVHSVVGTAMANCSCGKRRLLNGELRASCQETCTVRGSALRSQTLGTCRRNVWDDSRRKIEHDVVRWRSVARAGEGTQWLQLAVDWCSCEGFFCPRICSFFRSKLFSPGVLFFFLTVEMSGFVTLWFFPLKLLHITATKSTKKNCWYFLNNK